MRMVGLTWSKSAGAEEEAVLSCQFSVVSCQFGVSAVYDKFSAFFQAKGDVAGDLVEVCFGDERAEIGLAGGRVPGAVADAEVGDAGFELADEGVGGALADGDGDADGHAALTCRAVGRADEGVGGLVEIGVRHDDHVVLRAAERLDALAGGGAGAVDVLGDGRGADEADGLDGGVGEDGVDGGLVAVDDVEDAVGKAGLLEHLGDQDGGAGVALAGLEDEGVSAGQGYGEHPHGDHGGEVEGGDAGDDAEGLAHGVAVHAGADLLCEFALEKLWNSCGKLDDLEAAGGLAAGVGEDLAVLAVDERGDLVEAALEDLAEAEEDAGAAQRRLGGPLGEGGGSGGDGGIDLGHTGEGDAGLHAAGGGVEDVREAAGGAGDASAGDPVADVGDGGL